MHRWLVIAAALAAFGCGEEREREGLPAATSWTAPAPGAASDPHGAAGAGNPHARGGDPHAGLGMGGDPHAGLGMGGDPHAGLGMGGDPHAGLGMGGDPHAGMDMGALQAPDPSRPIDPSKFLRGSITATPEVKDAIAPGAVLFLSVRPIEPVTGDVIGQPLAVDRLELATLPAPFSLTEAQMMVRGTVFEGDVEIYARVDGDGEATSKEPGDVEGSVRAKIPAEGLTLTLDTLLR